MNRIKLQEAKKNRKKKKQRQMKNQHRKIRFIELQNFSKSTQFVISSVEMAFIHADCNVRLIYFFFFPYKQQHIQIIALNLLNWDVFTKAHNNNQNYNEMLKVEAVNCEKYGYMYNQFYCPVMFNDGNFFVFIVFLFTFNSLAHVA